MLIFILIIIMPLRIPLQGGVLHVDRPQIDADGPHVPKAGLDANNLVGPIFFIQLLHSRGVGPWVPQPILDLREERDTQSDTSDSGVWYNVKRCYIWGMRAGYTSWKSYSLDRVPGLWGGTQTTKKTEGRQEAQTGKLEETRTTEQTSLRTTRNTLGTENTSPRRTERQR